MNFIAKSFNRYLKLIKRLDGKDPLGRDIKKRYRIIEKECGSLHSAINAYLKGYPHRAYDFLKAATNHAKHHIKNLLVEFETPTFMGNLYRVRLGSNILYSQGQMFHIPFNKRKKVSPQRYSIIGLPCLYLSSSVYTAWEEMKRPDFNEIQLVRLEPTSKQLKILDFGFKPAYWGNFLELFDGSKNLLQQQRQIMLSQAVVWPLIFACSIKVEGENDDAFRYQYIVPQLVLQWLRHSKRFDGITYFSMNTEENILPHAMTQNYAFPVKTVNNDGFCPTLTSKFKMTQPISWQILSSSKLSDVDWTGFPHDKIELIEGHSVSYLDTTFGDIQMKLQRMPVKKLKI